MPITAPSPFIAGVRKHRDSEAILYLNRLGNPNDHLD